MPCTGPQNHFFVQQIVEVPPHCNGGHLEILSQLFHGDTGMIVHVLQRAVIALLNLRQRSSGHVKTPLHSDKILSDFNL